MISTFVLNEHREDCRILLNRALLGKTLAAFGVDGEGEFGKAIFAKQFKVTHIEVYIDQLYDERLQGSAIIELEGYNSHDCGLVMTDRNIEISINKCLSDEFIDPTCWCWGNWMSQGLRHIVINFNPEKLLALC